MEDSSIDAYDYYRSPYDDFMRKHLSHYGYYTEKNKLARNSFPFNEHNRNHGYQLSSSDDEDEDEKKTDVLNGKQTNKNNGVDSGSLVYRSKEPRELFAGNNPFQGPHQLARWPAELEVAVNRIKHLFISPKIAEPFYKRSDQEDQPTLVPPEEGRIVFQLQNQPGLFFIHSRVGGTSTELRAASVELCGPEDNTLLFESRFECGNLEKAIQVGELDYQLWLRNDLYTKKHTQWYYFQIRNTRKNQKYRFTICNFMKSSSLYNNGMKPCFYSEKDADLNNIGWRRMGADINYYKSNMTYFNGKCEKPYYALTFTITFNHDYDTVYLAHCYPYTYSDLQDYLKNIVNDEEKMKYCRLRILTRTLAGNLVYLLSITSPLNENQPNIPKKAVVVSARVHPGETNASWMMKGLIDYLLSDASDAKLLRDTFVFKIVPMLNPDGVIVGNYRCSLAGTDLNRNYKSQLKESYPTIMSTKAMIKRLTMEREVLMYCDLHGHSRKQNVFIYGCENKFNKSKRLHERIFPLMLSKNCPEKFVFEECSFKIQRNKEGTGRIVMWNMGITNSFTLEATFCGSTVGKKKDQHFNIEDFESMGFHFCDTLLDYCDPDKSKYKFVLSELENALKDQILQQLEKLGKGGVILNGKTLNLQDPSITLEELLAAGFDTSDDDEGSDSSLSDGLPVNIEYLKRSSTAKKKKQTKSQRDGLRKSKSQASILISESPSAANSSPALSQPESTNVFQSTSKPRHERCHELQMTHEKRCASARRVIDKANLKLERMEARVHARDGDELPKSSSKKITKDIMKNGDTPYHQILKAAMISDAERDDMPGIGVLTQDSSTVAKDVNQKSNVLFYLNESELQESEFDFQKNVTSNSAQQNREKMALKAIQNRQNGQGDSVPKVFKTRFMPIEVPFKQNTGDGGNLRTIPQKKPQSYSTENKRFDEILFDDLQSAMKLSTTQTNDTNPLPVAGKYLERMVNETDKDIAILKAEINDISRTINGRHLEKESTILELATRHRANSRMSAVDSLNRAKSGIERPPATRWSGSYSASSNGRSHHSIDTAMKAPYTTEINQHKQTVSKVSVHMSRSLVPSAPKASRRVQVKLVPASRAHKHYYE